MEMLFHSSGDEGVFQHAAIQPINMFETKQWEAKSGGENCSRLTDNRFTPLKNKGVTMPCCVWAILTDCFPLNTTPVLTEELSAPPTGWCVYERTRRRKTAKQEVMQYVTVCLFCLWWASIIHKKSFKNIDFLLKILEIFYFYSKFINSKAAQVL